MVLIEFLSTFVLGLVSGVSFSHLLQRGPKKTLSAAQFLAVQQVLLRNHGRAIGSLEAAALFLTLTTSCPYSGEASCVNPSDSRIGLRSDHGDYLGEVD